MTEKFSTTPTSALRFISKSRLTRPSKESACCLKLWRRRSRKRARQRRKTLLIRAWSAKSTKAGSSSGFSGLTTRTADEYVRAHACSGAFDQRPDPLDDVEIGRASCRERGRVREGAGSGRV